MPGDYVNFLQRTRNFGATNNNDRIYALRGLVLPIERETILIDYKLDYLKVYGRFAETIIGEFGMASMVDHSGMHTGEKGSLFLPGHQIGLRD